MQNINDKEKKTATSNIEIITAVKLGFMEEGESTKRITKNFKEGQELGSCTWLSIFSLNYIIVGIPLTFTLFLHVKESTSTYIEESPTQPLFSLTLTWDQALFLFCFENNVAVGKAK